MTFIWPSLAYLQIKLKHDTLFLGQAGGIEIEYESEVSWVQYSESNAICFVFAINPQNKLFFYLICFQPLKLEI